MIELLKAIQRAFNANTNLTSVFANGLENAEGADLEALPSCILLEVADIPAYNTSRNYLTYSRIQFTARAATASVVRNALDQLQKTFDHQPLTLANGDGLADARIVGMNRVFKEDERVYRGDVEYQFTVGRTL